MEANEPVQIAKVVKSADAVPVRKKSSPNWHLWQVAFLSPLISVFGNHGKAIDAEHARNGLIFRIVVGVVCVVGTAVVAYLRHEDEARRRAEGPAPVAVPRDALSVTYRSTLENKWPVEMALLRRMPSNWIILGTLGLMAAFLIADQIHRISPVGAYVTFPLFWAASTALWLRLVLWSTRTQIKQRDVQGGRICTTSLTADGVVDETPDRTIFVPWRKIRHVWDLEGAVVFATAMNACYVTPGAFPDEAARLDYLRIADQLWRSNGRAWDEIQRQLGPAS